MKKLLSLEAKWERGKEGPLGYKDQESFTGIPWESPALGDHSRPRNKAKRAKERGGREWKGPLFGCMAGQGAEKQGPDSVSFSVT